MLLDTQKLPTESVSPSIDSDWKVPEILAPAGGRAQFFAALQAGADAVYLGLKSFNARGRAENFTIEDLQELMPLAREAGMKVLVTLNILLKETELSDFIDTLAALQWLGIEAVIIQDIGVARLVREHFPHLRMHASTQMAVHNRAGVLAAAELGFRRVVLARELTAQEIRKIRRSIPADRVELEAFCHGSLCYSYSGLCFFSGAEDARSGNRGECAYTCRKPYKILNEPGHGFLFSMKDLDTSLDLETLVYAGVDTLKIEGRKKDSQYVATTIGLYREQLNRIFKRETGRAPLEARDFRKDMAFSFHRDTTRLFVRGRYVENVIDLANPTHRGLPIGTVISVQGRSIELVTREELERFDGLRIDNPGSVYHAKPQHGEQVKASLTQAQQKYANEVCQFSLREFMVDGKRVASCKPGSRVRIFLPDEARMPRVGDEVFKIRSNELKRYTERLAQAPADARLRPLRAIAVNCSITEQGETLGIKAVALLGRVVLAEATLSLPAERPRKASTLASDLRDLFHIFGDSGFEAEVSIEGQTEWFAPKSRLKQLKQDLSEKLSLAQTSFEKQSRHAAQAAISQGRRDLAQRSDRGRRFQIKIDRLEYLPILARFRAEHPQFAWNELVFEPKRAFLGTAKAMDVLRELEAFCAQAQLSLRLALPTVIRAWDEPLLRTWLDAFRDLGGRAFEIGNLGCLPLLEEAGFDRKMLDLSTDFTLYSLNNVAVEEMAAWGVTRFALSVEDDADNVHAKLATWPLAAGEPQIILYKDTPLFIAEACSLTALHHGCPTASVCGYRTLEIANDEGEKFYVAHESCKSIVYGAEAYSITLYGKECEQRGVRDFRMDFLTRPYSEETIRAVLLAALHGRALGSTHSANFTRQLL